MKGTIEGSVYIKKSYSKQTKKDQHKKKQSCETAPGLISPPPDTNTVPYQFGYKISWALLYLLVHFCLDFPSWKPVSWTSVNQLERHAYPDLPRKTRAWKSFGI